MKVVANHELDKNNWNGIKTQKFIWNYLTLCSRIFFKKEKKRKFRREKKIDYFSFFDVFGITHPENGQI